MKKKGARDIPDFSRQSKGASQPDAKGAKRSDSARPPVKPPVKPQASAGKSGQRGQ